MQKQSKVLIYLDTILDFEVCHQLFINSFECCRGIRSTMHLYNVKERRFDFKLFRTIRAQRNRSTVSYIVCNVSLLESQLPSIFSTRVGTTPSDKTCRTRWCVRCCTHRCSAGWQTSNPSTARTNRLFGPRLRLFASECLLLALQVRTCRPTVINN